MVLADGLTCVGFFFGFVRFGCLFGSRFDSTRHFGFFDRRSGRLRWLVSFFVRDVRFIFGRLLFVHLTAFSAYGLSGYKYSKTRWYFSQLYAFLSTTVNAVKRNAL